MDVAGYGDYDGFNWIQQTEKSACGGRAWMSEQGSHLVFLSDPRLAPYATGDIPVWLWSADATRILWGNPAAAAIFNAASSSALTGHTIDPKGSAALQIARLAGTLPHAAALDTVKGTSRLSEVPLKMSP